jgi:anaerobic selenocysteine-containing dehydrogenase
MTARDPADEFVKTACPRDCYDGCGVIVHRRHGRIVAVRGDPDHFVSRGTLCGKCSTAYNREWRDSAARLLQPLRRLPGSKPGKFEAVSWATALGEIGARLGEIVARHGGASVLNAHYTGTISLLAGIVPMRFFNRLGATEVLPDTICNMAGHVALRYVYGSSLDGFDPRTAADAACIVVWGANPHASAPHAHAHWLPEAPGRIVVIDPVRTPTAAAADLHLQPFPGTDAALAFGLLHVIRREGLIDAAFVARHTVGWDELEPAVAAADPATTAAATGVPAALIERAAILYGRGPSLLWLGQGLQRQATGGNVMRACAMLPAVTGNLGKPGAGFLYLNGNLRARGIDEDYLSAPELAGGVARPEISHMDLAAALADESRSRALFVWNMNPLASCPNQARLRRALTRENLLTIALDLFPTDTTAFADYVLPAASFLEFDDLVASYFHLSLSAQVKAAEPLGEALPNQEIFRRLARQLGFEDGPLRESDAEILAHLLAGSELATDFPTLAARGTRMVPERCAVQFADLRFATPSGRIEIASARAELDGLPRVPQCWSDSRPASGRLRLLSPAHDWLLNTSFGNVRQIAGRLGEATLALHPDDARERSLEEGDRALVRNASGELSLRVRIADSLPRRVALVHKGRWLGAADGDGLGGNVNALNDGRKSDMGESTAVHSVEVQVVAARASPHVDGGSALGAGTAPRLRESRP